MEMAQKDETEGRCPACRSPYDKDRIVAMAANCQRLLWLSKEFLISISHFIIKILLGNTNVLSLLKQIGC